MDWSGCEVVERVEGRLGGAPVMRHSRVTADAVWTSYLLGEKAEDIVYSFDLPLGDVSEAIEYAVLRTIPERA